MGTLILQGRFPPDRLNLLRILARSLDRGRLAAYVEARESTATVLVYDWQGVRVTLRVTAAFFARWEAHHGAARIERELRHRALQRLWATGRDVSVPYQPTPVELELKAAAFYRPRRRMLRR